MKVNHKILTQQGFSLPVVLVVIVVSVIIGIIIGGLALTAFRGNQITKDLVGQQIRGRDALRKTSLRELQAALEMYKADQGGFPNPSITACSNPFISGSVGYMKKIPCDPSTGSSYQYSASSTQYCLRTCLENTEDSQKDSPNNKTVSGCNLLDCSNDKVSYTLRNP